MIYKIQSPWGIFLKDLKYIKTKSCHPSMRQILSQLLVSVACAKRNIYLMSLSKKTAENNIRHYTRVHGPKWYHYCTLFTNEGV